MRWIGSLAVGLIIASVVWAGASGGPLGRTGAFDEPGCNGSGCHRSEPFGPSGGAITLDVGPYVPGQRQRILVTVRDAGARRWGFQLAAREARNPQRQAGSLSVVPEDTFVWVRCRSLSMPPCNNELEYATHTSLGSRANTPSGYVTFRVDWTAPAADVGSVIFTAAGLAADGDQGTGGDHSFTTTAVSLFAASTQPVLADGGVVNGASFARPDRPVSEGTIISLFGERLAPAGFRREVSREVLNAGRLPIELNRIGADFLVPNRDPFPSYVLFVSERQINAQVPELPAGYAGPIQVQPVFNRGQGLNEVRGNRVTVNIAGVSPGLFTFDGRYAAAVHASPPGGAPVGRVGQFPNARPARPGDVILVYGTGFGPTQPRVEPGTLAAEPASLVNSVRAQIGGISLAPSEILYAGAAPTFAGLQQFNLRVPEAVPNGDQPIVLTVGLTDTQAGVVIVVQR